MAMFKTVISIHFNHFSHHEKSKKLHKVSVYLFGYIRTVFRRSHNCGPCSFNPLIFVSPLKLKTMQTQTTETKVEKIHVKMAQEFKLAGLFQPGMSMNELLVSSYKAQTGAKFFKTFKEWKTEGYTILKGSKGFPVFSRPIGVLKEIKGQEGISPDLYKMFGTCYLFNELQVKK